MSRTTKLESHANDPLARLDGGRPGKPPLPEPRLSMVYRLEATVGQPLELGEIAQVKRRIVPLTGGTSPGQRSPALSCPERARTGRRSCRTQQRSGTSATRSRQRAASSSTFAPEASGTALPMCSRVSVEARMYTRTSTCSGHRHRSRRGPPRWTGSTRASSSASEVVRQQVSCTRPISWSDRAAQGAKPELATGRSSNGAARASCAAKGRAGPEEEPGSASSRSRKSACFVAADLLAPIARSRLVAAGDAAGAGSTSEPPRLGGRRPSGSTLAF